MWESAGSRAFAQNLEGRRLVQVGKDPYKSEKPLQGVPAWRVGLGPHA